MEKIESGTEIEEETRNYLGLNFIRAPKKYHDAIAQIGKPFVEWFKKHGVRPEIYYLSGTASEQEMVPEGLESIAKTLSIKDNEEVWVLLQFYRDRDHADEITAKMMQDESMGHLINEFDGLITQGSSLIMGGFSRLRM